MAKINNENKGNESIPRCLIFDTSLSDRARFVYCYMSAKPEGWDFVLAPMAKELNYSVDTLRKYIAELVSSGWIVKGEQSYDEVTKKFGSVEYTIKNRPSRVGKNPSRQKPDTAKTRDGKNPTQEINSTINSPLNNIEEERKRLSNDNQKAPDELFLKFWESYGYKKGRDKAVKAWNRLTKKEKEAAIKCIPVYKEDCLKHDRNMKYPSTYLNGKTWEDDFDCDGKVSDGEGFADLPAGLTPEKWEQARNWFKTRVPRIAGSITPNDHLSMMALARWKRDVYIEILIKIEASDYTGSILEEFERISETEEYSQRLWGNE